MVRPLSNHEIRQMDKDYKPEEKRKKDRRKATFSYCDPAMERRAPKDRRKK